LFLLICIVGALLWGAYAVYDTNLLSRRAIGRVLPFAFVILFGIYAINKLSHTTVCNLQLNTEYFAGNQTKSLGAKVSSTLEDGHIPAPRLHHNQGHGCVVAEFEVDNSVPYQYKKGIFSQPGKKYQALIRFSSSGRKRSFFST
jgi:hypothetical protein